MKLYVKIVAHMALCVSVTGICADGGVLRDYSAFQKEGSEDIYAVIVNLQERAAGITTKTTAQEKKEIVIDVLSFQDLVTQLQRQLAGNILQQSWVGRPNKNNLEHTAASLIPIIRTLREKISDYDKYSKQIDAELKGCDVEVSAITAVRAIFEKYQKCNKKLKDGVRPSVPALVGASVQAANLHENLTLLAESLQVLSDKVAPKTA